LEVGALGSGNSLFSRCLDPRVKPEDDDFLLCRQTYIMQFDNSEAKK